MKECFPCEEHPQERLADNNPHVPGLPGQTRSQQDILDLRSLGEGMDADLSKLAVDPAPGSIFRCFGCRNPGSGAVEWGHINYLLCASVSLSGNIVSTVERWYKDKM
jgi:hypothetical protein